MAQLKLISFDFHEIIYEYLGLYVKGLPFGPDLYRFSYPLSNIVKIIKQKSDYLYILEDYEIPFMSGGLEHYVKNIALKELEQVLEKKLENPLNQKTLFVNVLSDIFIHKEDF